MQSFRVLIRRSGNQLRLNRHLSGDSILSRNPYEELKVDLDNSSSQANPMKINAYGDERTIACVCDDMHFMTLKKGPSVKCKCGHWFQLVDANKFWKKENPS